MVLFESLGIFVARHEDQLKAIICTITAPAIAAIRSLLILSIGFAELGGKSTARRTPMGREVQYNGLLHLGKFGYADFSSFTYLPFIHKGSGNLIVSVHVGNGNCCCLGLGDAKMGLE